MLNRHVKLALLLSSAWLSQAAAHAGELTLFSGAGFQGREVTVREATRDLVPLGFNDRAASMIIRSGRWEVCVDADYRNECRVFEPGEYRNLDRMANTISSVREIEGGRGDYRNDNRADYRDRLDERDNDYRDNDYRDDDRDGRGHRRRYQAPSVQLFDTPGLRGRSVALRGDTADLVPLGFNDAARSMVIEAGSWEICQHRNYGGECRVFGPGEYRYLDRAFQRSITSARVVAQEGGRGRDDDERGRREGVELFSSAGFGGERVQVRDEVRKLDQQYNFHDRAGSLIVYSGQWEFCRDADFRGQCMTYGPGRYDRLGSLHNAISSIRRVR
jgi:hypothetical protein